jgi:hypothetical protein
MNMNAVAALMISTKFLKNRAKDKTAVKCRCMNLTHALPWLQRKKRRFLEE